METYLLGERPLSVEEVHQIAQKKIPVELSPKARERVQKSHDFLLSQIRDEQVFYGVNTGFGFLANVKIAPDQLKELQYNIVRSHATGAGHFMPDRLVRAMLLLRASTLAEGFSGVSFGLIQQLLNLLNHEVYPLIPQQGSVGASGDLCPLAHLALVLIGEGQARVADKEVPGAQALRMKGLTPIELGPKEGLALINGTQFMSAIGCLTLKEAEHLADLADLIGSMTLEALRGSPRPFEAEIHEVRPHPGQKLVAKRLRSFLNTKDPKGRSEISQSHGDQYRVQDPYSLRCMPQVHGAVRDCLTFVREVLTREIQSVTDNPLVFPDKGKILSGGNFHGQIVAFAMDQLCIATAELASISEQRISKLVNPAFSGLPTFLTPQSGLNSGFMIVHVAAASIVSENKTLCHPASVDSIPTNVDQEDHVSMGAWAARKAARVVTNVRRVLAMELLTAAQGLDLLRPLKSTPAVERLYERVRKTVPMLQKDRNLHADFQQMERLFADFAFEPYVVTH